MEPEGTEVKVNRERHERVPVSFGVKLRQHSRNVNAWAVKIFVKPEADASATAAVHQFRLHVRIGCVYRKLDPVENTSFATIHAIIATPR